MKRNSARKRLQTQKHYFDDLIWRKWNFEKHTNREIRKSEFYCLRACRKWHSRQFDQYSFIARTNTILLPSIDRRARIPSIKWYLSLRHKAFKHCLGQELELKTYWLWFFLIRNLSVRPPNWHKDFYSSWCLW